MGRAWLVLDDVGVEDKKSRLLPTAKTGDCGVAGE
jgi:hypothetical protein